MALKPGQFREVQWDDVRLQIKALQPDLFTIIEAMSPDKSYKLYEGDYPYGAGIVNEDGMFCLPVNGELKPIGSSDIPAELNEQLDYQFPAIPLGLVLNGEMQLSLQQRQNSSIFWSLFEKGSMFPINAILDRPHKYQAFSFLRMTAGPSSVYMLPSICNKANFSHVQKHYGLDLEPPETQKDHWKFFRDIANSPNFKTVWNCKILFFGKKWIDTLQQNIALRLFLLDYGWRASALPRNNYVLEEIWNEFFDTIRNKKVDRYVLAMARYIFETSIGKHLSYQIADTSDSAGPFNEIARIITEVYGLKKYAPIIMVPRRFNPDVHNSAYLSIQLPTINITREYLSKNNFLMADFREIYYVVTKFATNIRTDVLNVLPLYDVRRFNYEFYSADKDRTGKFLSSEYLFSNDDNMKYWLGFGGKNVDFRNTFTRACVTISRK